MISIQCSCGRKLQVRDELAGREGKCPACGKVMRIPARDAAPTSMDEPILQAVEEEEEVEVAEVLDDPAPRRRPSTLEPDEEPEEIRNHGGGKLSSQDDFFVKAPAEIGQVESAWTSLRKDKQPMTPGPRLAIILGSGTLALLLGVVISLAITGAFLQWLVPFGFCTLAVLIVLLVTRFSHVCTYVGSEGVARYSCSGSRDNISGEVFNFADAAELRTQLVRHYTNNIYQNTTYSYTWTDIGGRTRFTIAGQYRNESGNPPTKDPYQFATAAERAWTIYLLNDLYKGRPNLQFEGEIRFGLGGRNYVKLSHRLLSVHWGGVTTDCPAEEIQAVRINQGQVEIRRTDAQEGWFSSTGIYRFSCASMANIMLFRILMKDVVEVEVD